MVFGEQHCIAYGDVGQNIIGFVMGLSRYLRCTASCCIHICHWQPIRQDHFSARNSYGTATTIPDLADNSRCRPMTGANTCEMTRKLNMRKESNIKRPVHISACTVNFEGSKHTFSFRLRQLHLTVALFPALQTSFPRTVEPCNSNIPSLPYHHRTPSNCLFSPSRLSRSAQNPRESRRRKFVPHFQGLSQRRSIRCNQPRRETHRYTRIKRLA